MQKKNECHNWVTSSKINFWKVFFITKRQFCKPRNTTLFISLLDLILRRSKRQKEWEDDRRGWRSVHPIPDSLTINMKNTEPQNNYSAWKRPQEVTVQSPYQSRVSTRLQSGRKGLNRNAPSPLKQQNWVYS